MRTQWCWVVGICTALSGCSDEVEPSLFSDAEWEVISTLSPLGEEPPSPTNQYADDPAAADFGQRLFFEKSWAGPLKVADDGQNGGLGALDETGKVACVSCHSGVGGDDRRTMPNNTALGADYHTRNAPPVVNSGFYLWTNWAGRFDAMWELPPAVLESGVIFNSSRLRVAHVISDKYLADYNAIFTPITAADIDALPATGKPKATAADPDGPWEGLSTEQRDMVNRLIANVGKALEAYVRTLVSRDGSFDRFVAGDERALSAQAKQGLKLFVGKAGCVDCHKSPHLSDDDFHDTGVPQASLHAPAEDTGRFKDVPPLLASAFNGAGAYSDDTDHGTAKLAGLVSPAPDEDKGKFRTKGLRLVADTGNYMHNGVFTTLAEVVSFYNDGGVAEGFSGTKDSRIVPLNLTSDEQEALVAFLESLSGEPVAAERLVDTSAP